LPVASREEEKHLVKAFITAAFATIIAAALSVVHAQTSATSETRPENGSAAAGAIVEQGQIRASKILGSAVYNTSNAKIGAVKELVLDKDGRVAAVIVDVAFVGLGDKYVAVNLSDISANDNHVILDRTRDQLQQMASYKLESGENGAGTSSPKFGRPLNYRSPAKGGTAWP
jgi:sporulation protein YlmC with PRC-barrel domain